MDDDDKLIFKDDSATLSWLGFGEWQERKKIIPACAVVTNIAGM
jgi:hypothetical protein